MKLDFKSEYWFLKLSFCDHNLNCFYISVKYIKLHFQRMVSQMYGCMLLLLQLHCLSSAWLLHATVLGKYTHDSRLLFCLILCRTCWFFLPSVVSLSSSFLYIVLSLFLIISKSLPSLFDLDVRSPHSPKNHISYVQRK